MTKEIILTVLNKLIKICQQSRIKIIFMGGIAINVWSRPRTTYDIDASIQLDRKKLSQFLVLAKKFGFSYKSTQPVRFIDGMPFITLIYRKYKMYVDLFLAKTEYQVKALSRAKKIKLKTLKIQVISAEDLILYKLLSRRNRDLTDVREIIETNYPGLDLSYLKTWARKIGVITYLNDELRALNI